MHKLLVIQTAFTGDVVLATAIIEKLHTCLPDAKIDFLLRKGNETLLLHHPFLNKLWVWDKKTNKNLNLFRLIKAIRKENYTHVINLHRFGASGLITLLSGAKSKIGFDKNPFSFCYTKKIKHIISKPFSSNPIHEVGRNQMLIADLTDNLAAMPKLYPSVSDYASVKQYQNVPYICIAPSSVWFTKQFPADKWIALINKLPLLYSIYLIGAPTDNSIVDYIALNAKQHTILNFCGKFSFLQSTSLMQGAIMNYVNDSAPLHFASAIGARVTAVFCSTVPAFGFGILTEISKVVETEKHLSCRPCGLHGFKSCPQGHFNCAYEITNKQLMWWITDTETI